MTHFYIVVNTKIAGGDYSHMTTTFTRPVRETAAFSEHIKAHGKPNIYVGHTKMFEYLTLLNV